VAQNLETEKEVHGFITAGDIAKKGAGVGATGGGVLSALASWGVSKQHIIKYEDHVKSGRYLVVAHGSAEEVERARTILSGTSTVELSRHAETATTA